MLVGQLLEGDLIGEADVVHEYVHTTESLFRPADELGWRGGIGKIERESQRGTRAFPGNLGALQVSAANDDAGSLCGQYSRGFEPDSRARAGDDAYPVCEAEIHVAYRTVRGTSSPTPLASPAGRWPCEPGKDRAVSRTVPDNTESFLALSGRR